MTSNIHRFLSRRERRQKVNSPCSQRPISFSPASTSFSSQSSSSLASKSFASSAASLFSPLLFWRHGDSLHSRPDGNQDDNAYGWVRRNSCDSVVTTRFDLPFSLDGAGSIKRSRKDPASTHVARHLAIASTANCDIAITLQSTPDVVPDVGTFADFFLPDEEARKKKLDKDEEKAVRQYFAIDWSALC